MTDPVQGAGEFQVINQFQPENTIHTITSAERTFNQEIFVPNSDVTISGSFITAAPIQIVDGANSFTLKCYPLIYDSVQSNQAVIRKGTFIDPSLLRPSYNFGLWPVDLPIQYEDQPLTVQSPVIGLDFQMTQVTTALYYPGPDAVTRNPNGKPGYGYGTIAGGSKYYQNTSIRNANAYNMLSLILMPNSYAVASAQWPSGPFNMRVYYPASSAPVSYKPWFQAPDTSVRPPPLRVENVVVDDGNGTGADGGTLSSTFGWDPITATTINAGQNGAAVGSSLQCANVVGNYGWMYIPGSAVTNFMTNTTVMLPFGSYHYIPTPTYLYGNYDNDAPTSNDPQINYPFAAPPATTVISPTFGFGAARQGPANFSLAWQHSWVRSICGIYDATLQSNSSLQNPIIHPINNSADSALNPTQVPYQYGWIPKIGHTYLPFYSEQIGLWATGWPLPPQHVTKNSPVCYNSRDNALFYGNMYQMTWPTVSNSMCRVADACQAFFGMYDFPKNGTMLPGVCELGWFPPQNCVTGFCAPEYWNGSWSGSFSPATVTLLQCNYVERFPSGVATAGRFVYTGRMAFLMEDVGAFQAAEPNFYYTGNFIQPVEWSYTFIIPPGSYTQPQIAVIINQLINTRNAAGDYPVWRQVDMQNGGNYIFTATDYIDDTDAPWINRPFELATGPQTNLSQGPANRYGPASYGHDGRCFHAFAGPQSQITLGAVNFQFQLNSEGRYQFTNCMTPYIPAPLSSSTLIPGQPSVFVLPTSYSKAANDPPIVGNAGQSDGTASTTPDPIFLASQISMNPIFWSDVGVAAVSSQPLFVGLLKPTITSTTVGASGNPSSQNPNSTNNKSSNPTQNIYGFTPETTFQSTLTTNLGGLPPWLAIQTSQLRAYLGIATDPLQQMAGAMNNYICLNPYGGGNQPGITGIQLSSLCDGSSGQVTFWETLGFDGQSLISLFEPELEYIKPVEGIYYRSVCDVNGLQKGTYAFSQEAFCISNEAPYLYASIPSWLQDSLTPADWAINPSATTVSQAWTAFCSNLPLYQLTLTSDTQLTFLTNLPMYLTVPISTASSTANQYGNNLCTPHQFAEFFALLVPFGLDPFIADGTFGTNIPTAFSNYTSGAPAAPFRTYPPKAWFDSGSPRLSGFNGSVLESTEWRGPQWTTVVGLNPYNIHATLPRNHTPAAQYANTSSTESGDSAPNRPQYMMGSASGQFWWTQLSQYNMTVSNFIYNIDNNIVPAWTNSVEFIHSQPTGNVVSNPTGDATMQIQQNQLIGLMDLIPGSFLTQFVNDGQLQYPMTSGTFNAFPWYSTVFPYNYSVSIGDAKFEYPSEWFPDDPTVVSSTDTRALCACDVQSCIQAYDQLLMVASSYNYYNATVNPNNLNLITTDYVYAQGISDGHNTNNPASSGYAFEYSDLILYAQLNVTNNYLSGGKIASNTNNYLSMLGPRIPRAGRVHCDSIASYYFNLCPMLPDRGIWGIPSFYDITQNYTYCQIFKNNLLQMGYANTATPGASPIITKCPSDGRSKVFAIVTNYTPNNQYSLSYPFGSTDTFTSGSSFVNQLPNPRQAKFYLPQPFNSPYYNQDLSEPIQQTMFVSTVLEGLQPAQPLSSILNAGLLLLRVTGLTNMNIRVPAYIQGVPTRDFIPCAIQSGTINPNLNTIAFNTTLSWNVPAQYVGYLRFEWFTADRQPLDLYSITIGMTFTPTAQPTQLQSAFTNQQSLESVQNMAPVGLEYGGPQTLTAVPSNAATNEANFKAKRGRSNASLTQAQAFSESTLKAGIPDDQNTVPELYIKPAFGGPVVPGNPGPSVYPAPFLGLRYGSNPQ